MKKNVILMLLFGLSWLSVAGADVLTSPNGKLTVTVTTDNGQLEWSVKSGDTQVLLPSPIQAVVDGQKVINGRGSVARRQEVNTSFQTPVYRKQQVDDHYRLLVMKFQKGTTVEFRAYDDAVAYRICLAGKKMARVDGETVEYRFAGDHKAFVPYVNDLRDGERYSYSFESYYDE